MGFVSLISPIRDLSDWKKILDYGVNSKVVTCFVADAHGKIILFEEGLIYMSRLPARTLSRMPVRDLRTHLGQWAVQDRGRPEKDGDLFVRTDFRDKNNPGILTWWGFPVGTLSQPSGIYFLRFFDHMPSERQVREVELPTIRLMWDKIHMAAARYLLDDADQRILYGEVAQLMEWEERAYKKNRVLLVDGVTLDDGPKPIYLEFEGPEDHLKMIQENTSLGDIQFFRRMAEGGGRPALVEHTLKPYRYEIMLPLTWYVHILGWIGIPLSSLNAWMKPVRLNFEEIVRNMGDALGEERMALGLLPKYDVHRGMFEMESFMTLMDRMISRHPPRPFVLLLIRGPVNRMEELKKVLDRSKRPSDILSQNEEGMILLFPDQDVSKVKLVESRYLELLGRLAVTHPDLATSLSLFWFPSTAWSSQDLLKTLVSRPRLAVKPNHSPYEKKADQNFDDWFRRFLILKDWE